MLYTPSQVFLSQNLDLLAASLAERMEEKAKNRLLQKQWIFVPSHSLKQWLLVQLARFSSLGGVAGCKIYTLDEWIHFRFKEIPNRLEMRCLIYEALNPERSPEVAAFLKGSARSKLELSRHLAELFSSYGQHGLPLEKFGEDWQVKLFCELFGSHSFRLPMHLLPEAVSDHEDPIYCFGFSFIPEMYWQFLNRFSSCSLYLFSPCVHFWEDVCTDKEQRSLSRYWKKKGVSLSSLEQAEYYFSEAPSLLANWGKLGRETFKILDRLNFESESLHVSILDKTVLHALQMEILLFEKKGLLDRLPDGSIEIFLTGPSPLREVEVLQEEIHRLVKDCGLLFSDILVLAPEIEPYVPLIEYVFSGASIPYRFPSLLLGSQSSFSQGLSRLVALGLGDWTSEKIVSLLETASFIRRQKIDNKEREEWIGWVEEIFRYSPDWENGFCHLLQKAISLYPGPRRDHIQIGEFELLEKLFLLLQSLQKDLREIGKRSLTLSAWADLWQEISVKYLCCDEEEEIDSAAWRSFCSLMVQLRGANGQSVSYPFEVIEDFLTEASSGSIHGGHLHAVRCASFQEGAIVPAKAIFIIGMDEESFPKKKTFSSLDLLQKQSSYVPDRPDRDRYLFLQALMSAQEFLKISYGHLSQDEGKEVGPSLLVQELLSTLGPSVKQIVVQKLPKKRALPPCFSLVCPSLDVYREPLDFVNSEALQNAQNLTVRGIHPKDSFLSLSDLSLFARHPWKYYLQKQLRIYLEDRSDLSFVVQRAILLRSCVKWPLETVFSSLHEKLPGLFDKAFFLDVENKQQERQAQFSEWGKKVRPISFLETACMKKERSDGSCELPPLEVRLDNGSTYWITGEIPFAMEDGILHLGEDKLSSLLKIWPEALAVSIALESSNIYFLKTGKIKSVRDPEGALKQFVEYFIRCRQSLSPLLTDWADGILRKSREDFSYEFEYEDVVNQWIGRRLELPDPKALFDEWGWLRDSFAGLIDLYPSRLRKGGDETV